MSEIICRECHSPNKSGSKFCSSCGASLKPATHIICPNCYHRNSLHLLYCDNCGTRLIKQSTPTADAPITAEPDEPISSARVPFSLPTRSPGETGELDPDSLPDWLKTGVADAAHIPAEEEDRLADWLSDLKTQDQPSGMDELGEVSLDWLQEPSPAASPPPTAAPLPTEPVDDWLSTDLNTADTADSGFDWLSAMGDEEGDTAEEPIMGATGAIADDSDWLFDDDGEAENDTFVTAESGRTGFTGWLESKMLNSADAPLDDEDDFMEGEDESDLFTATPTPKNRQDQDLPDWLLGDMPASPPPTAAPPTPPANSGFTGWLREQDLMDTPDEATAFTADDPLDPSAKTGFTSWLSGQGLDADDEETAETATTAANNPLDDVDLPDWLTPEEPVDEASLREEMVGTGFTGWLDASKLGEAENDNTAETWEDTAPASAGDLPSWLDTGLLTADVVEEEEAEVGTGFTGWLNPTIVDQVEAAVPSTPTEEIPDWLAAGPSDDDEESGGTGFTDWLSNDKNNAEEGDEEDEEEFDWMNEEPMPQELMTPLSKEEAHKLLENTPDVSEEFIKEVVDGDFPDWLTDVTNNEDAVSTDVLPAWISAPLSTTDELELGLRSSSATPPPPTEKKKSAADDDWLTGLGASTSPTPALGGYTAGGDDWLSGLGTGTAAADEWGDLDALIEPTADDTAADDWGSELLALQEDSDDTFPSTSGDDSWLADLPTDTVPETAANDWMADLQTGNTSTGFTDFLSQVPDEEEDDEWEFGELETRSAAKFTSELSWMDLDEPEATAEPSPFMAEPEPEPEEAVFDEFSYLQGDEEPTTPTAEEAGDFDWLGALDDVDLSQSEKATAAPDRQAWLHGEDLEDAQPAADEWELDEALQATVFTRTTRPTEEPQSTTDIAELVSNLRQTGDNAALDFEDEEILSELEALRDSDELDPSVVDDYEAQTAASQEMITGEQSWLEDDLLANMGITDPTLQHKQVGGPLDGLVGVLPIATLATAAHNGTLTAATRTLTPAQEEQTALLRQLSRHALPTAEPAAVPTAPARADVVQILLGLLLLAAVATGLLLPTLLPTTPPTAAPSGVALQQGIANLQDGTVLVVFDYTPSVSGELNPAAEILLKTLTQNNNRLLTMTQHPTGLLTAAPLLNQLPAEAVAGSLGYVPGQSLGLRQLADCLQGAPCATPAVVEITAVLLLTGDQTDLQNWVEQVAPSVPQPIYASVTEALAPMAEPYFTSGQLHGLWSGLPATAASNPGDSAVETMRQGQTLARLLAAAVFIVGALVALLPQRKGRVA